MHEMSIATSVIETAQEEQRKHPASRVTKIGLRIGEWSGVDQESLRFCFEALVSSEKDPPVLEIEYLPRQNRCPSCNRLFRLKNFEIACPECGSSVTEPVSGDEMDIAFVELEEA